MQSMHTAITLGLRALLFASVVAATYLTSLVWMASALAIAGAYTTAARAVILPSWVDVAATGVAVLVVSLIPSSRLRALPVALVCGALVVCRVVLLDWLGDAFNFLGDPRRLADYLAPCMTAEGVRVFAGVFIVAAAAFIREPSAPSLSRTT